MKNLLLCSICLLTVTAQAQTPTITGLLPTRNSVNAPRATAVTITTAQPIDPVTITNVQVNSRVAGGKKAGTYTQSGNSIIFTPTTAFQPGEKVQVSVPNTVKSLTNVGVPAQVYEFITAAPALGGGAFSPPATNAELIVANGPRTVLMADIDGDTDLDLVSANSGVQGDDVSTVNIYRNSGLNSGNFVAPTVGGRFDIDRGESAITLGDIDGDGDLDLVNACNAGLVEVRRNDGVNSGNFTVPANKTTIPLVQTPGAVRLGDLDGDGDLDMLVNYQGGVGTISLRLNRGLNTGDFVAPAVGAELSAGGFFRMELGDIDSDGDLDILGLSTTDVAYVLLNNGLNTARFVSGFSFQIEYPVYGMGLGDVTGDGRIDLVVNRWSPANVVEVWRNTGNRKFELHSSVGVAVRPVELALGDVDGDGDLDVVVGNEDPALARRQ
ncbi:FG-GAP-like repeat-containing protein [Hymenobacter cellulosilyticus]|uniref:FG-GAP-like repeat-containing protein n=1 Tax=Hymenobacter cellulosilyticus TaxID=2932248 RepID=A0A8T9QCY5_9BACT|nr:FG-GAP-like repeat-containing protein [Hymenobacter cellulosilyticus]UOQ73700.1 FG-GAP-like repeat-containing protein [Hymenobacter cellulosilyticus]